MRRILLILGFSLAVPGTLIARPPLGKPELRDLNTVPRIVHANDGLRITSLAGEHIAPMASALNETIFFGGTAWAPDSMRWEAIPGSVWTFDSGVGSAIKEPGHSYPFVDPYKPDGFHAYMEGWVGLDRTAPAAFYFRRLASNDPRWQESSCVGSIAGLGGTHSFWAGVFESEADSICWEAGRGYGNSWHGCLGRTFAYSGGPATLSYRYRNDSEQNFDFTTVWVDTSEGLTEDVQIASYTGTTQGLASITLHPGMELPSTPAPLVLKFCFDSDSGWSDEDGLNPTPCGAFALDDIVMTGGVNYSTNFELDDGGWTLLPIGPGAGGDWSNLEALDELPAPPPVPRCGMEDSVLVLYDPSTARHPGIQDNMVLSPWIDLARAQATHLPGRVVELGGYFDLPLLNYILTIVGAQWYPDTCSITGQVGLSVIRTTPYYYYFHGEPTCLASDDPRGNIDIAGVVPPHATQLRIGIGVVNFCPYFGNCTGVSNSTPWLDNIRFGAYSSNSIQDGINSAAEGDTVWVPPGRYRGPGNRDINLRGKKLVLKSMAGPEQTIIDCEGRGRGLVFDSGEDSLTVVDGFTIENGSAPIDSTWGIAHGGGILVTGGAAPIILNCTVQGCEAQYYGGGVDVADGASPIFRNCTVTGCETQQRGGGIYIWSSAAAYLQGCSIVMNVGGSGAGVAADGRMLMRECLVSQNIGGTGGGLQLNNTDTLLHCTIVANRATTLGGGIQFGGCDWFCGSGAVLRDCVILQNIAQYGGGLYGYSGEITRCLIAGNAASVAGGGGYVFGSRLADCRIAGNSAPDGGGLHALWNFRNWYADCPDWEVPEFERCEITGNAAVRGGGIYWKKSHPDPCPASLINTTVSGNHATQGGGIYLARWTEVDLARSVVWGNCADSTGDGAFLAESTSVVSIDCSVLDPAEWTGTGTISYLNAPIIRDPSFCLPLACTTAPDTGGVYSVSLFSPCLPGNNSCQVLIGALEDGCKTTAVTDEPPAPPAATRLTVFPNPCAGRARVVFGPSLEGPALVRIVGLDGRLVRVFEPAGNEGTLTWDGTDRMGRDVPAGVYFVEVRHGRKRETIRLVVVR